VIGSARFFQRVFEGQIETPPVDSTYSSKLFVVAEVYEAGTISYLGPTPDWNREEFKDHYCRVFTSHETRDLQSIDGYVNI